jgi:hypothetical protein
VRLHRSALFGSWLAQPGVSVVQGLGPPWVLLAHRRRGEAEGRNGKKNADLRGTLRPFRTLVARRTFAGRFRAASISVLKRRIELRHQGDKQHGSILQ